MIVASTATRMKIAAPSPTLSSTTLTATPARNNTSTIATSHSIGRHSFEMLVSGRWFHASPNTVSIARMRVHVAQSSA